MTPEVVGSYGPSSYPYVSGSLSSSRPASTESKATTTSACFFEVPHANQNDDLMVRPPHCSPTCDGRGGRADLMSPFSKPYATFTKRLNARQFTIWYEQLLIGGEKPPVLSTPSSSTSSPLHQVVSELLSRNAPQLPFLTNGVPKLSWFF